MTATVEELRVIADQVCEWRPDWSHGAVLNVLYEVREGRRGEEILLAATRAAKDTSSRTPASIGFPVHWQARRTTPAGPFMADPLPECSSCGQPAQRHRSGCTTPACNDQSHILRGPVTCPACKAPWVPMVFRETRVVRTNEEQRAINERGMAKVAQAILDASPNLAPADVEAAMQGHCAWCSAAAGQACRNDSGIAIKGVHSVRVPVPELVVPPW